MTPEDRRHRMKAILDDHDRAMAEFQESDDALQQLARHVQETSEIVRAMTARLTDGHAAMRRATTAVMAANRAALALFNEPDDAVEDPRAHD